MTSAPLLTVIAICFNHERFVVECLESIRAQTHRDYQLIIADDGSTDRSKALIREWIATHGVQCTFVDHRRNLGLLPTLNEVLALARGKYIAKVSTDDAWLPFKLERQLMRMDSMPDEVAVLYQNALQVDESGVPLAEHFLEAHGAVAPPSGRIAPILIRGNFIPSLTTLVRRQCLVDVGGYDERLNYEDWDMWLRLSLRYQFAFDPQVNARYRIVKTSLVRNAARGDRPATLYSNVLIMDKIIASGLGGAEVQRTAAWNMEAYTRRLIALRDSRAVPATLRFVPSKLRAWLNANRRAHPRDVAAS